MRRTVASSFGAFTRCFEGALSHMYLDVLGLPTCGYGNLIDTAPAACALPWLRTDGSFASRDEVIAEWALVRSHKDMARLGGVAFAAITKLRLDELGVANLLHSVLQRNDEAMKRRYPDWESWPACAQLACLSLCWACGVGYDFPRMDRALLNRDFDTAAREIRMTPEHNPGNHLEARNHANELLMRNAGRVEAFRLNPDLLTWECLIGVNDVQTVPALENPESEPTLPAAPTMHADPEMYRLGDEPPDDPEAA